MVNRRGAPRSKIFQLHVVLEKYWQNSMLTLHLGQILGPLLLTA